VINGYLNKYTKFFTKILRLAISGVEDNYIYIFLEKYLTVNKNNNLQIYFLHVDSSVKFKCKEILSSFTNYKLYKFID
jgi:hypothetical protein